MERYQVTFWNSVPAFMEMLAAEERNLTQALASLRTVVMGGDFLPVSLVKQLKGEKPTLCVHSVGGPTETTIWNISHEITADDLELDVIPYGKPFPNTTYFICNAAGQPAPMGVIGEMCVAGVGVSAGYLGMPEKTAQAFPQWNHRRAEIRRHPLCGGGQLPAGVPTAFFSDGQRPVHCRHQLLPRHGAF